MPRFAANLTTLFRELPLLERAGAAAAAGFDAIEIQFPYAEDPRALRAAFDAAGLPLVLMNFPVGDLMQGGEGLAAVPGREAEFEQAAAKARHYAQVLRPRAMNLLAGRPHAGRDRGACEAAFRANLERASEVTRELGIRLLTEPVNSVDLPGFFLDDSAQALELIADMPGIELGLQYDFYHAHMMGADIAAQLPAIIDRVGHIQFSDAPGRTEPGLGVIDFDALFALVDELAYPGYVGAEYFPTCATADTLAWLEPWRQ